MADGGPKTCPNIAKCELFPHFSKAGLLRVWQINYCEADYSRCERFKLSQHGKKPEVTMLPNGRHLEHWKPGG
jgi:hypothetical protein